MTESQRKIVGLLIEMADEIHENATGIWSALHSRTEELPELSRKRRDLEEQCDALEEAAEHAYKIIELLRPIE